MRIPTSGFLKRLDDLLRRKVITETEFERLNQAEREQNSKLEADRDDLKRWLEAAHDRQSMAKRLPTAIGTFIESFERPDPRQQEAHLRTILKSAYVYTDCRVELEFRE